MSTHGIIQRFGEWREGGEPMVLATVYDTLGSTYTKAGHRILIAANGDYQGLVSGGCLEGDLAERARKVLETGNATTATYDMRDDGEDLWGLGVGCNGLIRVFLQQLLPDTGYEPFASIANGLLGVEAAGMAVVVASGESDLVSGATLIWDGHARSTWQLDSAQIEQLTPGCATAQEQQTTALEVGPDGAEVLYLPLVSIPRLLVLGAGLDAVPLVRFAAGLGWLVTVVDHRPAYLEQGDFSMAERAELIRPDELATVFALDQYDAIVVMSHHLVTDRTYLAQLERAPAAYLGVLGPGARRDRLLNELGASGEALRARLKGPVGLEIGADSPESIALSVLAEIHGELKGLTAATLSPTTG
jgi:xanthine/CO dehydrogenase XdhC/CoxF family maturation factor